MFFMYGNTIQDAMIENTPMQWDEYFLGLLDGIASKSKDESTQVGAIITTKGHSIISTGFNGAPRGLKEIQSRPEKYFIMEHAERNALYNALRVGVTSFDFLEPTMYVPWTPCHDCARGIIQSGIRRVVIKDSYIPKRWMESCQWAIKMLDGCGSVELVYYGM